MIRASVIFIVLGVFVLVSCGGKDKLPGKVVIVQDSSESAYDDDILESSSTKSSSATGGSNVSRSSGKISVTAIKKGGTGNFSITVNNSFVIRDVSIKDGKIYFPQTAGRNGRKNRILYFDNFRAMVAQIHSAFDSGKIEQSGKTGGVAVTGVKWKEYNKGSMRGFADITINGAMTIKGARLISGKKGYFIGYPSIKKDGKYVDLVFPTNKDVRAAVLAAVKRAAGI